MSRIILWAKILKYKFMAMVPVFLIPQSKVEQKVQVKLEMGMIIVDEKVSDPTGS